MQLATPPSVRGKVSALHAARQATSSRPHWFKQSTAARHAGSLLQASFGSMQQCLRKHSLHGPPSLHSNGQRSATPVVPPLAMTLVVPPLLELGGGSSVPPVPPLSEGGGVGTEASAHSQDPHSPSELHVVEPYELPHMHVVVFPQSHARAGRPLYVSWHDAASRMATRHQTTHQSAVLISAEKHGPARESMCGSRPSQVRTAC
jgi:hypothetical protein